MKAKELDKKCAENLAESIAILIEVAIRENEYGHFRPKGTKSQIDAAKKALVETLRNPAKRCPYNEY